MSDLSKVEQLESRLLMSIVLNGRTLLLSGTELADTVTVTPTIKTVQVRRKGDSYFSHDHGKIESGTIRITVNDETAEFSLAQVRKIIVNTGAGDDSITMGNYSALQGFGDLPIRDISAVIDAGDGNDLVMGSQSNETIHGGLGDDSIYANYGPDRIFGDEGNDTIDYIKKTAYGKVAMTGKYSALGCTVHGGEGDDWIDTGRADRDVVTGGPGADIITLWAGQRPSLTNISKFTGGYGHGRVTDRTVLDTVTIFDPYFTGGVGSQVGSTSIGGLLI